MTVTAPRRIVFVAPFALEPRGTVSARMIPIARELQARGHDVTIVVPPWDNLEYSERRMEVNGVEVVNLRFEGGGLEHVRVVRRLVSAVRALGPDLVHVFKPIAHAGIVAVVLSQFRRLGVDCPVVLDSDDWEGDGGQNERSRRSRLEELVMHYQERFAPRVVDAVTVASKTLETQMWGLGIDPERVFYVPNGQDPDRFEQVDTTPSNLRTEYGIGDGPIVLLYTRFFEYELARVIEVFRQVRKRIPNVQFVIVGEGRDDDGQVFGQLAESAGIGESVHLTGWVEFDELPRVFELADVAVYPFDDTLVNRAKCPAKLTELMLAGQCIVAEDVGQVGEYLVNGQSGLLSPPGDTEAFADNLIRAVRSPELQQQLGSNARKRILEGFAWEEITTEIESAYEYSMG
ncbi:glycosyltransferase family 4 protein [Haloarchaeobius amylolyticus]|uniref:Glycosyltransferase family 4 protein n=1 Tax=Haloarchaeobius amylolyticus TaxID=1198296 RepID=A0ABD6BDA4_9EURY